VEGRDKVVRLVLGLVQRFAEGVDFTTVEINGEPALTAWAGDTLLGVLVFELRAGLVLHVRAVVNPDKLEFAGRQLARA
jgi:hypothetical protein